MSCTGTEFDCGFIHAVRSIAGVFVAMTEEDAGGGGGRVVPVLDGIGAILCPASVNAAPVALGLPNILLSFTPAQPASVHGANYIISVHGSSARQHGTLFVLPAEAFSMPAERIPPSKALAAMGLAGLMDDAEPIGEVLAIWTVWDGAFVVSAEGETSHGGMVAVILLAFHHRCHWGRDWHWWRAVVVRWEFGLVTTLCPALMLGAVPLGGALGQVLSLCLAPFFGTCLIYVVSG
jgi:hypothetical protein